MLVKEIMTKNVVTIEAKKSAYDAAMKYKEYKVGCLVVEENGYCVGILTERDMIERVLCLHRNPDTTQVHEIMTAPIRTIYALDNVEKAIQVMKDHHIKKLPVISNNAIVGIITITDISNARSEFTKQFMETWMKPQWQD
jgi:CBS domain-containing protein